MFYPIRPFATQRDSQCMEVQQMKNVRLQKEKRIGLNPFEQVLQRRTGSHRERYRRKEFKLSEHKRQLRARDDAQGMRNQRPRHTPQVRLSIVGDVNEESRYVDHSRNATDETHFPPPKVLSKCHTVFPFFSLRNKKKTLKKMKTSEKVHARSR